MQTDWKVTALSPHSSRIEDSLLCNAPYGKKLVAQAKDIIAGLNGTHPFSQLEWLKIHSFHELEGIST